MQRGLNQLWFFFSRIEENSQKCKNLHVDKDFWSLSFSFLTKKELFVLLFYCITLSIIALLDKNEDKKK